MTSVVHEQTLDVPREMTTTAFELPGCTITQSLGVVRGVVVRSRSFFGTLGAGFQTLRGGDISLFTELAERARRQAFETMLQHTHKLVEMQALAKAHGETPFAAIPIAGHPHHLTFAHLQAAIGVKACSHVNRRPGQDAVLRTCGRWCGE